MNKAEKTLMTKKKLLLITDITSLIIYGIMFMYIRRLEKSNCLCSQNKESRFLKYATLVMIVSLIISIFLPSFFVNKTIKMIFNMLNMVVIFVLFIYIRELGIKSCECAIEKNEYTYEFLKIYSLISFYIIIFVFVVFISVIIGFLEFPKYGKFDIKQFRKVITSKKSTDRKSNIF